MAIDATMSQSEFEVFLAEPHTTVCATIGPHGRPHAMPLWYLVEGDRLTAWTFVRTQKARNLERDPRATLVMESGRGFGGVRGAMLETDVELIRDPVEILRIGIALFERYLPDAASGVSAPLRTMLERQAPKRVGLRFRPLRTVTWDHSKLPPLPR